MAKILPSRFACRLAFAPTYTRTPALNRCPGREVRVGGEVTDAQNTITRVSTTRPPNSRRSEDLLGSANRAYPGRLAVCYPFVSVRPPLSLSFFLSLSISLSLLQPPWAGPERVIHFTFHVHFILRGLASFEKPKLYSYLLCFFVGARWGRRWFPFPGRPLSIRPTMGGPYFPDNTNATPSSGTVDVNTGN